MDQLIRMEQKRPAALRPARPRVVIVGAGFAGLNAALALRRADVDVTVIDRHNYHLFQPLLYQVATAGLSPNQIATPIRQILSRQENTTVLLNKVIDVDLDRREVVMLENRVPYDFLIIGTGARHAYFGHNEWAEHAPGLKKIEEATEMRKRILFAFERAEISNDTADRHGLLTFVIVGAGPTGVEMAGAISELARKTLVRDFRNIDPADARIILIEAGPRVLPTFSEKLSASAERQLQRLGVEVVTGDAVAHCGPSEVHLASGRTIETSTIIWGAGVMASPAARWLKVKAAANGRVAVGADLKLPGSNNVYVIGDTAAVTDVTGRLVPGVAPAAKQMGRYAARSILASIEGRGMVPFAYRDYGNLATIGRKAAVADFGRISLSGLPAWLVWGLVHVGFLIGFRNRATVMLDWAWSYVTFGRGARLITGIDIANE